MGLDSCASKRQIEDKLQANNKQKPKCNEMTAKIKHKIDFRHILQDICPNAADQSAKQFESCFLGKRKGCEVVDTSKVESGLTSVGAIISL